MAKKVEKKKANPLARKKRDRNPLELVSDVVSAPGRLAKKSLGIPMGFTDTGLLIAGVVLAGPWLTGALALGTFLGRQISREDE